MRIRRRFNAEFKQVAVQLAQERLGGTRVIGCLFLHLGIDLAVQCPVYPYPQT